MRLAILAAARSCRPGRRRRPSPRAARRRRRGSASELGQIRAGPGAGSELRTAGLEVRLSRLEEQLRQLTGRIEEVEYAQRQTSARHRSAGGRSRCAAARRRPAAASRRAPKRRPSRRPRHPSRRAGQAQPSIIAPDAAGAAGLRAGHDPRGRACAASHRSADTAGSRADRPRLARSPKVPMPPTSSALDLLQAGNWAEAEQPFSHVRRRTIPNDPRAPTASYWLGETYSVPQGLPDRGLGVRPQLPDLRRGRAAGAGQSAQARHVAGGHGRPGQGLPDLRASWPSGTRTPRRRSARP